MKKAKDERAGKQNGLCKLELESTCFKAPTLESKPVAALHVCLESLEVGRRDEVWLDVPLPEYPSQAVAVVSALCRL